MTHAEDISGPAGPSDDIRPLHGWLIIDKPVGLGSTQLVGAVKRILRECGEARTKVGHGGTLDPLAQGVLPIALGEATKLAGRMLDASKTYCFTICFGTQTDTLDREGEVVARSDHLPDLNAIKAVLPRFTGAIRQAPPAYSAIKVDGRRAYDRARAGEDVEMKMRDVVIRALSLHSSDQQPGAGSDDIASAASAGPVPHVTLVADVSKGTYIRSLARDIALALGTVGHVSYLRRTRAGPFAEQQAIPLDNLRDAAKERGIGQFILPLTAGLDDIPALPVSPPEAEALRQGRRLVGKVHEPGLMLALLGDVPVALVEGDGPEIRVVRGFNL